MHFDIRKGMTRDKRQRPIAQTKTDGRLDKVAILGADYPNVIFDVSVAEGDTVRAGQTVAVDRQRPEICFVASASGTVSKIELGRRRRLAVLEITIAGDAAHPFGPLPDPYDAQALRQLLLESGAWTGFRTRPFGLIPDPQTTPEAIFVTATPANPQAPDPVSIINSDLGFFQRGAEALLHLTSGPVFICQRPGPDLVNAVGRLKVATFSGSQQSGLSGTHIHAILPVSRARMVWEIGYQDVIAMGHLLETGRIMPPRRVCAVGEREAPRPFWHRLMDRLPAAPIGATLPREAFERAFPFDILPVPLMRALAIGDVETCERLGCLELLEEDLALLSWLCPSGSDYGKLLRQTLDILAKEHPA